MLRNLGTSRRRPRYGGRAPRRIRLSAVRTCRPRLCRCGRARGRTGRDACRSTSCAHGRGCRTNATERRTEGCRPPWQSPRMEHLWSRADATGGNWSQVRPARKRLERGDWQPLATAGTLPSFDGKEGSTVRVRQRAIRKPRKSELFRMCSVDAAASQGLDGAVYGAFASRTPSVRPTFPADVLKAGRVLCGSSREQLV